MTTDIFSVMNRQGGAQFFKFEKIGDKIHGKVVDINRAKNTFGNEQITFTLENDSFGEDYGCTTMMVSVPGNMANENCIRGLNLEQELGIEWYGSKDTGKGKPARLYNFYFTKV
jgi:hypothetical protein